MKNNASKTKLAARSSRAEHGSANPAAGDEELARHVAHIMGENSAAAAALRRLDEYRAAGKTAHIEAHRNTWFVVGEADSQNGEHSNTPTKTT